jgi:thiamine-monophosphate kinase
VNDPGEFGRIRAIVARLGAAASGGIGDDCAVLPEGPGRLVVSTDLSVEGVHFKTEWLTLEEIGWRAAAGALSDLAAMGAETVGLLASVATPPGASPDAVIQVMAGVGMAVQAAGGVVLGGDLSRAPQWLVDVTVIGRAARPVLRSGAQPGDSVWVTGALGGARAALQAWQRGQEPPAAARVAFAHPLPRIGIGKVLADDRSQ